MLQMIPIKLLKSMLIIGLLTLPDMLHAQVTINAQFPAGGMMQKEQLWNLSLVSSQPESLALTIKLSLQDATTGMELLSASTGNILLEQGIKLLTNQTVQPIIYNYTNPEFSGTFLPMGNYIACYQVISEFGETPGVLASECINFKVEPLSPPLLSAPADKSEVSSPYPFFVWMPPAPIDMFSSLSYDLIVTEVNAGQSAADAIEFNIPVYANTNINQPNQNYPESFTRLDTAKTYAWQVIARNGFSYIGKTEVWTFTIVGQEPTIITPVDNNYILLENELKGTYFISGANLNIKYISFEKGHDAIVNFLDAAGNVVDTINKFILPGDNYIELTLSHKLKKETVYLVAISDISGKSHLISISLKK